MEDPRLSRMYARHLAREFGRWRRQTAKRLRARRRAISFVISLLLVAAFAAGYVAHIHGRFSKLKREIKEARNPTAAPAPTPGGQDPIVLQRAVLVGGSAPEFLSATVLPGRGMDVLQVTAYVPGRGEVPLLEAPSLEEATKLLDSNDPRAKQIGAPFELPWGGSIAGPRTGNGTHIVADWRGRGLILPYTRTLGGADLSSGGLFLPVTSASVSNNTMPDGGAAQGTFEAGTFGGVWPSKTIAKVEVLLSSRALDMRVTVMNAGQEPIPMGVGWSPHLRIPSGNREQARLRLPLGQLEEFRNGRATGRFVAAEVAEGDDASPGDRGSRRAGVSSTRGERDFAEPRTTRRVIRELGTADLTETLVHLRPGFLDSGPVVELRDTAAGVGLRITAMTPLIRAIGIEAPAGRPVITIRPQMNYDDPWSRVWPREEDTGIVVLAPGQTVQWKVRMELFSLSRAELPL